MEPEIFALFHEFMTLQKFTDVSFIIDNESPLQAHKIILAADSPVFRTMFETNMLESRTHQVVLTDVNKADFRAFLDYLYTRDVKYLEGRLSQMYTLADKYNVERLEQACDELIIKSLVEGRLSNATLLYYLLLVDSFERVTSKKVVTNYIRQNLQSFMSGDEWKTILDRPSLLREVLHNVVTDERTCRGSEGKREIFLNCQQLARIEDAGLLEVLGKDSIKESSMDLTNGKDQISISIGFKSEKGRVLAELRMKNNIVSTECLLLIESVVLLLTRKFSNNQTTVVLNSGMGIAFAMDLVVFEHNGLKFAEPITIIVKAKLCTRNQVAYNPEFKPNERIRHRFSDAVILLKQGRFPVHKVILAAKSNFFEELFRTDSHEYRINVDEGLSEKSFELLLDFIYSGHHPDYKTEDVMELLIGAHKFQLEDIVKKCIPFMNENISCDNVVNFLKKGDTMNFEPLKSAALSYVIQNKGAITNLGDLETHPELLKEVLLRIAEETRDQ